MTYVIVEACIGMKDRACVDDCPVDCIYEGEDTYIHPDECIDCGACEPECPVQAIYYEDDLPDSLQPYTEENVKFFTDTLAGPSRRPRITTEAQLPPSTPIQPPDTPMVTALPAGTSGAQPDPLRMGAVRAPGRRDLILQLLRTSTRARDGAPAWPTNWQCTRTSMPSGTRRAGARQGRRARVFRRNHRPRPTAGLVPGQPPDGPGRTKTEVQAAGEMPEPVAARDYQQSHHRRSRLGVARGARPWSAIKSADHLQDPIHRRLDWSRVALLTSVSSPNRRPAPAATNIRLRHCRFLSLNWSGRAAK